MIVNSTATNPQEMRQEFIAMRPPGGFRVILEDPAWRFQNYSEKGEAKNPNQHYRCMTPEEIQAMPVEALAAKDCALFIWVTWPTLPQWLPTIKAHGFAFAGLAWEWRKFNPETGKYAFGPGYGTRKNLEPCLLATRGNPSLRKDAAADLFGGPLLAEGVRSVRDFIDWWPEDEIRSPQRDHSQKPPEQYQRIETLFDGPYVELNARNTRPGWSSWGNEVGKLDGKDSQP